MKRIITILLTAALTVGATNAAFALTQAYTSGDVTISGLLFKLSNNVHMTYDVASDKTGYAIAMYHNKGTKTFGSSSGDSKIFEFATTAEACPTAPVGTASASFGTGWSAL